MNSREKKYMVLFVDIEDGKVGLEGVYESDKLGELGSKVEPLDPTKTELPNFSNVKQIGSITTLYATFSPGCRYIKIGGVWKKVCR